tara:strand:+ start:2110 stop:2259 length:150 start_codon:yes stop_codon:yes gene_type:complete
MVNALIFIASIAITLLMLPILAGLYTAAFYIAVVALLVGAIVFYIKHLK